MEQQWDVPPENSQNLIVNNTSRNISGSFKTYIDDGLLELC